MSEEKKDFEETAKETIEETKETVKEISNDGKTVAIIAHLTIIGWVIAIIMNSSNKSEIGSFYIRQVLGIMLLGFVCGLIPVLNLVLWILPFVMWIISLVGAFGGKQKPVFLLGTQFQQWFKGL
ncbi:YtxH domain-containing protein [Sungkyunkwania multivorans]|uniref:YtxH domain-containing protein n=1 Tax=Sungkyunkwania multivorans TaxID=1173618 RepID=A0ABW3CU13_9FLAO